MTRASVAVYLTGGWLNYAFDGRWYVGIVLFACALLATFVPAS